MGFVEKLDRRTKIEVCGGDSLLRGRGRLQGGVPQERIRVSVEFVRGGVMINVRVHGGFMISG